MLLSAISKRSFFSSVLGINWQVRPPLTGLPPIGKASAHKEHHFNTSLANLVVLRGREVHSADVGKHTFREVRHRLWSTRGFSKQLLGLSRWCLGGALPPLESEA